MGAGTTLGGGFEEGDDLGLGEREDNAVGLAPELNCMEESSWWGVSAMRQKSSMKRRMMM